MLIIPIGIVHRIFKSDRNIDVFLFSDYSLNQQWVAYDIGNMLQFLIVAYLAYKQPRLPRILLASIFYLAILDIVFYFLTEKTGWYSLVYYFIAMILIIKKSDQGFRVFMK